MSKKPRDKRGYAGPSVAGPLDPQKESPLCESCGEGRDETTPIYKVSNGDWFHAPCYEGFWGSRGDH